MCKKIQIKDYAQDGISLSYEQGKHCYNLLKELLQYNDKVILDFDGVNYALTAFLNPVFSKLIVEYSDDVFKNIEIVNANEQIIKKIKMIKKDSLVKREDFFI